MRRQLRGLALTLGIGGFLWPALSARAADGPLRLELREVAVSDLQAHSGQTVILSGYFRYGFEASTLLPVKQRPQELSYDSAVWVEFAEGEEWKFLGFPFYGHLQVEGLLKARPGEGYGHLGGAPAELANARIKGILPRDCGLIAGLVVAICFVGIAFRRMRRTS